MEEKEIVEQNEYQNNNQEPSFKKRKKRKGFTLIELLAVIIILGVLMIVAIPAVTSYISSSRKSAYVDTAKEIASSAKNVVNGGKIDFYDTDTTYYIESGYIKTENASKSPYGEFVKAYTVVTYDGKGYSYYWTSVDDAGQGVKGIVSVDKLNEDDIVSDINTNSIEPNIGIGNRSKIKIIKADGTIVEGNKVYTIPEGGTSTGVATSTASGSTTPEVATSTATSTSTSASTGSETATSTAS